MRLTWKDALATVVAGVNVAVYVAFTQGADVPVIDSVRGASGTILLLGIMGGCALSAASESEGLYLRLAGALGVIALFAGLAGVILASELALAVLFYATIALWLAATVRHALAGPRVEATK
jgi:hypothetical protein